MKLLSRDFTASEKALIGILCLLLLGMAYYRFVDQAVRSDLIAANSERDALAVELKAVQGKLDRLASMQEEIDRLGSLDRVSRMGSYNNSNAELAELNRVLLPADDYSVTFSGITRDGDAIRRTFTLQFSTRSYATAKRIFTMLEQSSQRCLIGDVRYTVSAPNGSPAGGETITINTGVTFFETMYDGVPDSGLPENSTSQS